MFYVSTREEKFCYKPLEAPSFIVLDYLYSLLLSAREEILGVDMLCAGPLGYVSVWSSSAASDGCQGVGQPGKQFFSCTFVWGGRTQAEQYNLKRQSVLLGTSCTSTSSPSSTRAAVCSGQTNPAWRASWRRKRRRRCRCGAVCTGVVQACPRVTLDY